MFNFFHRLLNPHCPHCQEERELSEHCETCEVLKMELASVKQERNLLLEKLLKGNEPVLAVQEPEQEAFKSLRPVYTPWRVRQQAYEAESRRASAIRNAKDKELADSQIKVRPSDVAKPLTVAEMEQAIIGDEDAVSGSNA